MGNRIFPRFQQLLNGYPEKMAPCDQGWSNQCALRLSVALENAGFKLTSYTDPLCKHGHARGAESLANYLWKQVGPPRISKTAAKGKARTKSKTGIILFKNMSSFRGGRGDHIDLWDMDASMTGQYYDDSEETWFWSIS